jgi:large subunit ribosomal protein L13
MAASATVSKPKGFKTYVAKPGETKAKWFIVDADGKTLGRLASSIAVKLMGKDKATYTRHVDTGDFVVVVNAEKVNIAPRKRQSKIYRHWSGYLGGMKLETFEEVRTKNPARIIEQAVRKMLPKNLLAKQMLTKLKVYRGTEHPHAAQKPEAWNPVG